MGKVVLNIELNLSMMFQVSLISALFLSFILCASLFYRPIGDQSPILPPLLVPELMSWALNCDASSRVVLALLKAWPYKDIHFLRTLHLAFESIPGHQVASFVFSASLLALHSEQT